MLAELKGLKENCKPVWQIWWRKGSQDWMEMESEERRGKTSTREEVETGDTRVEQRADKGQLGWERAGCLMSGTNSKINQLCN